MVRVSKQELNTNLNKIINENSSAFAAMLDNYNKPVIGYTYNSLQDRFIQALIKHGIPVFPDPKRAAKALGAVMQYGQASKALSLSNQTTLN